MELFPRKFPLNDCMMTRQPKGILKNETTIQLGPMNATIQIIESHFINKQTENSVWMGTVRRSSSWMETARLENSVMFILWYTHPHVFKSWRAILSTIIIIALHWNHCGNIFKSIFWWDFAEVWSLWKWLKYLLPNFWQLCIELSCLVPNWMSKPCFCT